MVASDRVHAALLKAARHANEIHLSTRPVFRVEADESRARAFVEGGEIWEAPCVVLAAGAWTPEIAGPVPRLPIEPVRGQMLALAGAGPRRPVFVRGGYLTPLRDGRVLVGGTTESVGFDPSTRPEDLERLQRLATAVVPHLANAPLVAKWAGLRPYTPDQLPVIGRDPTRSAIIYATGHSGNGILLGPLTGECVAQLALTGASDHDLSPFSPDRFLAKSNT